MSLPHPSVSVVIPTFNEGDWVRRTVDAVLQQSGGWPLEVIVVDDGSTDGSCDFIDGARGGPAPIRLVRGGNLGSARARNRGALEATGEFLVFMDAHVLPDPGWLDELATLLADPTVGLAGLGVRDVGNPNSLGSAYIVVDENLSGGWADPPGAEPFESPMVIGCCFAFRRAVFEEIGCFDPGHIRWGMEDTEISLRTWFSGYRCLVSPRVQVAHYFKQDKPRNFPVSWEEFDVNLLRCVLTYFSGERLATVLDTMNRRETFARSRARVSEDDAFWLRRDRLRARFRRDEAWYFARFARELAPFEQRLVAARRELDSMRNRPGSVTTCSSCGGKNVGTHTRCLLCQAPLDGAGPCAGCGAALEGKKFCGRCGRPATRVRADCSTCGGELKPGGRFCIRCGTPVR